MRTALFKTQQKPLPRGTSELDNSTGGQRAYYTPIHCASLAKGPSIDTAQCGILQPILNTIHLCNTLQST